LVDVYVAWFSPDDSVWKLQITTRSSRRRRLGSVSSIQTLVDGVSMAMGELATGRSEASGALATAAAHAEELLLPDGASDHVVLNPPPDLFSFPWSALPVLTDRPVTVTPSAATYIRPRPPGQSDTHALVVAGPGLDRAADEARLVAGQYAERTLLDPDRATTRRVLDGLADSDVAHLACHAVYRPDNASFSYLKLADGPLFLHDLEQLRTGPHTVILSACSAARSGSAGNQLHGFVTALLRVGARTVIAPISPVPDSDETLGLIDRLHDELRSGTPPATALSRARSFDGPLASYVSHAFQCFGWG
jgi:hypothetical protein